MNRSFDSSFGFLVADTARLFRSSLEKLLSDAKLEISHGEVKILNAISTYGGRRQNAIAATLGVEPMTVSAFLDRLELRGLVVRLPDPSDRRAKIIRETQAAHDLFEEVFPLTEDVAERATRGIAEEKILVAEEVLSAMRKNLAAGC